MKTISWKPSSAPRETDTHFCVRETETGFCLCENEPIFLYYDNYKQITAKNLFIYEWIESPVLSTIPLLTKEGVRRRHKPDRWITRYSDALFDSVRYLLG